MAAGRGRVLVDGGHRAAGRREARRAGRVARLRVRRRGVDDRGDLQEDGRGTRTAWRARVSRGARVDRRGAAEHGRPAGARLADAVRAVQRRRRAVRVGARTARAPARRGDTRHGADPGRRAHVVDQTRRRGTASGRRVRTRPRRRGPVATGRTAGQRAGGRVGAAVRAAADLRGAGAPRRGRLDADRDRRRSHAARAAARRRPVPERGRRGAARARSAFGAGSGRRGADRPPAHRPGAGPGRLRGGRRDRDAAEARRPRAENRRPRLTLPGVHTVACTNPLG